MLKKIVDVQDNNIISSEEIEDRIEPALLSSFCNPHVVLFLERRLSSTKNIAQKLNVTLENLDKSRVFEMILQDLNHIIYSFEKKMSNEDLMAFELLRNVLERAHTKAKESEDNVLNIATLYERLYGTNEIGGKAI